MKASRTTLLLLMLLTLANCTLAGCGRAVSGHGDRLDRTATTGRLAAATPPATTAPAPPLAPSGFTTPTAIPPVVIRQVDDDPIVARLLTALLRRGIAPQPVGDSAVRALTAPGQAYKLTEDVERERLFLHVYPSDAAARANADQIPPTGSNGLADWIDAPHFFRCGNVIALYLGQQQTVLDALTEQCGPQFAGQG